MALSSNGLAGEIIKSICGKYNSESAVAKTMPELGHAIARYLTKNTEVKYIWSGIMPGSPPTTDSTTNYVTNKIVGDFICSSTNTLDSIMNGIILGKQITDGIRKFKIFPAIGFTLPPGGFLCAPAIVLPPYSSLDTNRYWLNAANVILKYYKMWIKPVPLMGAHGSYLAPAGAGAIMSKIY